MIEEQFNIDGVNVKSCLSYESTILDFSDENIAKMRNKLTVKKITSGVKDVPVFYKYYTLVYRNEQYYDMSGQCHAYIKNLPGLIFLADNDEVFAIIYDEEPLDILESECFNMVLLNWPDSYMCFNCKELKCVTYYVADGIYEFIDIQSYVDGFKVIYLLDDRYVCHYITATTSHELRTKQYKLYDDDNEEEKVEVTIKSNKYNVYIDDDSLVIMKNDEVLMEIDDFENISLNNYLIHSNKLIINISFVHENFTGFMTYEIK